MTKEEWNSIGLKGQWWLYLADNLKCNFTIWKLNVDFGDGTYHLFCREPSCVEIGVFNSYEDFQTAVTHLVLHGARYIDNIFD